MSGIISSVTSIVTAAAGWVSTFVGVITDTGNEILLLFAVMPLIGFGVGLLKRLLNVNYKKFNLDAAVLRTRNGSLPPERIKLCQDQ